ncbi:GIY-YIG nuclease family protein [Gammaproteobacteria bacterium]|nr:GIY-YIG nuclease family protein [Gammaproteobacteria bacterium]
MAMKKIKKPLKGYVYILSNEAMAPLIKIGCTSKDPEIRRDNLSRETGVPSPFKTEYYALFENYEFVENEVFKKLNAYRPKKNKEHFNCSVGVAISAIRSFEPINEWVTERTIDTAKLHHTYQGKRVSKEGGFYYHEKSDEILAKDKEKPDLVVSKEKISSDMHIESDNSTVNKDGYIVVDQTKGALLKRKTSRIPRLFDTVEDRSAFLWILLAFFGYFLSFEIAPVFDENTVAALIRCTSFFAFLRFPTSIIDFFYNILYFPYRSVKGFHSNRLERIPGISSRLVEGLLWVVGFFVFMAATLVWILDFFTIIENIFGL